MKTIKHKITAVKKNQVDNSSYYSIEDIHRLGEIDFQKLEQLEKERKARIEDLNSNQGRPLNVILNELGIT